MRQIRHSLRSPSETGTGLLLAHLELPRDVTGHVHEPRADLSPRLLGYGVESRAQQAGIQKDDVIIEYDGVGNPLGEKKCERFGSCEGGVR